MSSRKIIFFLLSFLKKGIFHLLLVLTCAAPLSHEFRIDSVYAEGETTEPLKEQSSAPGFAGTPKEVALRNWLFAFGMTGGVMLFARSHGANELELVWLLTTLPSHMSDALMVDRTLDQSAPDKRDLPTVMEALKRLTATDVVISLTRGSFLLGAITYILTKKGYPVDIAWKGGVMPFVQSGLILGLGHIHYNAWIDFKRWFGLIRDFSPENKAPKRWQIAKEYITQVLWLVGYHGGLAFSFENEQPAGWNVLLDGAIGSLSQNQHVIGLGELTNRGMRHKAELARELGLDVEATERSLGVLSRAYATLVSIICSSGVAISSSGFRWTGGLISAFMGASGAYLKYKTAEGRFMPLFLTHKSLFRGIFHGTNAALNAANRCGSIVRGLVGLGKKAEPPTAN